MPRYAWKAVLTQNIRGCQPRREVVGGEIYYPTEQQKKFVETIAHQEAGRIAGWRVLTRVTGIEVKMEV